MRRFSAIFGLLFLSGLLLAASQGWLPSIVPFRRSADAWEYAPSISETQSVDLGALRQATTLGFQADENDAPPDPGIWAIGPESRVTCTVLKPRSIQLAAELQPAAGMGELELTVSWNGFELGRARLSEGRTERVEFVVPAEVQLLGQNWLLLAHRGVGHVASNPAERWRRMARYRSIRLHADGGAGSLALDRAWLEVGTRQVTAPEAPAAAEAFVLQTDHVKLQPGDPVDAPTLQALVLRSSDAGQSELPSTAATVGASPPAHRRDPRDGLPAKNAVLVLLDACRADQLGAYGDPSGATPNLDRLARHGQIWSQVYSAAAYTLPSVSTLLSGLHSHALGPISSTRKVPHTVETMAESMSSSGLSTVAFAAASPYVGPVLGMDQGFQSFVQIHHDAAYRAGGCRAGFVVNSFSNWLRARPASERYFAYLHFREPHQPYDPEAPWARAYLPIDLDSAADGSNAWLKGLNDGSIEPDPRHLARVRAFYRAGLASADSALGTLFDVIKKDRHADSTLITVVADHGEAFFEHRRMSHNSTVYDEMIHIPWIMSLAEADSSRRGSISDSLAGTVDITHTIAAAVGVDLSPEAAGVDQLAVLQAEAAEARAVYSHATESPGLVALRTRKFKFFAVPGTFGRLFDVLADPSERHDVARALPVTRGLFARRLANFLEEQRVAREARAEEVASTLDAAAQEALHALGYTE